ncbi:MAG: hypothetical protein IT582_09600 [Opitutaceae bacterium]|nr:hypothetical protein [Opitutaceae bacterium]
MTMPRSPKSSALRSVIKMMTGVIIGLATAVASPSDESGQKFSVRVAPTIQRAFQEIWEKTPLGRGPKMVVADKAYPGQELYVHVMAHGLAVSPEGKAEADYSISVYKPDGTISYTQSDLPLVSISANADGRMVHKAPSVTGIILEPNDPAGQWRIVVEAVDRVSNATARSEALIIFEGRYRPEPLSSDAEQWLMPYHFSPKPQQLQAYLKHMAANPPMKDGKPRPLETMGPLLGFFEQVLADNPWLLPHLIDDFAQASSAEKAQLAGLLAYAKRDDAEFVFGLPAELKQAAKKYRGTRWPVPSSEPLDGAQLDVLWGRFFASGAYQPLRDLVGVLAYHPYRNALEEYQRLEKKPKVVPVEVYKNAVFKSAAWSLGSNIQQDTLVRDYCEGMLLREELPRDLQLWVLGALKAAIEKQEPANGPIAGKRSSKDTKS